MVDASIKRKNEAANYQSGDVRLIEKVASEFRVRARRERRRGLRVRRLGRFRCLGLFHPGSV